MIKLFRTVSDWGFKRLFTETGISLIMQLFVQEKTESGTSDLDVRSLRMDFHRINTANSPSSVVDQVPEFKDMLLIDPATAILRPSEAFRKEYLIIDP